MWSNSYIWTQKYCKYYLKKQKKNSQDPHYWRSNHSDCPSPSKHRWVNVWFPLRWTNWTAPVLLAWHSTWQPCGPFSSPPTPKECSVRARWLVFDLRATSWLHLEDCLTSVPPPTSGKRVSRLYWTGYPFGNRVTHRHSLSYGDDESDRYRHNLRRNPSGTVVSPTCQRTYCPLEVTRLGLWQRNRLAKLQRGPKFPAEGGA